MAKDHRQQSGALAQSNRSTPITGQQLAASPKSSSLQSPRPPPTQSRGQDSGGATSQRANPDSDNARPLVDLAGSLRNQQEPLGQQQVAMQPPLPNDNSQAAIIIKSRCAGGSTGGRPLDADCSSKVSSGGNRSKLSSRDTNNSPHLRASSSRSPRDKKNRDQADDEDDDDDDDDCLNESSNSTAGGPKVASTPQKSSTLSAAGQRQNQSNNFVRNSLPSRSVNFGHSKSSAYLDRIRASVTATTTTNTISSFNEQTMRNIVLASTQRQQREPQANGRYALNCMLDHQHSDRCFVAASAALPSQVIPSDIYHPLHPHPHKHPHPANHQHHHLHHPHLVHHHHHHHHPNQAASDVSSPIKSSRQLNALIDPVAHEQLMLSMLQQQQLASTSIKSSKQQDSNGIITQGTYANGGTHRMDNANLSEQQIAAHLNSLHRQHYYHHLHQLHQMHHLHLHHLQHKYEQQPAAESQAQQQQQQQQQQKQQQQQQQQEGDFSQTAQGRCNLVGGSQFFAPVYDQVYANMAADNNKANSMQEQNGGANQQRRATRLVSNDHDHHQNQQLPPRREDLRVIPLKQQMGGHLPQIDEMNGLPTVLDYQSASEAKRPTGAASSQSSSPVKSRSSSAASTSKQQANGALPTSPSSSPTSSTTSSNLSPSSATSSSSSLNSLSASNAPPLNRSALRHTTTDLSKRHFSVERELVGSNPMTATLSRVGSYRGTPMNSQGGNPSAPLVSNQMLLNPVKSQQPPMRTSKILSISQPSSDQHQSNLNRLSANLAEIKIGDNLAFSSLRAPKKSSSGSSLNYSLNGTSSRANNQTTSGSKALSSTSTPEKRIGHVDSGVESGSSGGNNNNNNSKVWFEYGCV